MELSSPAGPKRKWLRDSLSVACALNETEDQKTIELSSDINSEHVCLVSIQHGN